jgi:hypothetical protein
MTRIAKPFSCSLLVGLLCCVGCSRSASSMFNGQWIGWLQPSKPNTSNLTWYVSPDGDILTSSGERISFSITRETLDKEGNKGLEVQTDRGIWRIRFSKDGHNFGINDSAGQLIGGFNIVGDAGSLNPQDIIGRQ